MFKPEQETDIGPHIATPEGRVYFAGEQTSTIPAWIQVGIESGIKAAYEVNNLPKYPWTMNWFILTAKAKEFLRLDSRTSSLY